MLTELRLRQGEPGQAERHATAATTIKPHDQSGWAWLGAIWRLTSDPREDWLCDYDRLVIVTDVLPDDGRATAGDYAARVATALERYHVTRDAALPGTEPRLTAAFDVVPGGAAQIPPRLGEVPSRGEGSGYRLARVHRRGVPAS